MWLGSDEHIAFFVRRIESMGGSCDGLGARAVLRGVMKIQAASAAIIDRRINAGVRPYVRAGSRGGFDGGYSPLAGEVTGQRP